MLAFWTSQGMPFLWNNAAFSQTDSFWSVFSEFVCTIVVSLSLAIFIANSAVIYSALVITLLIASAHSVSKHGIYAFQEEPRLWENLNSDHINKRFQSKPLFGFRVRQVLLANIIFAFWPNTLHLNLVKPLKVIKPSTKISLFGLHSKFHLVSVCGRTLGTMSTLVESQPCRFSQLTHEIS